MRLSGTTRKELLKEGSTPRAVWFYKRMVFDKKGRGQSQTQMVNCGTISANFGPKAAHVFQMFNFGTISCISGQGRPRAPNDLFSNNFGPKAALVLQMINFVIISGHLRARGRRGAPR